MTKKLSPEQMVKKDAELKELINAVQVEKSGNFPKLPDLADRITKIVSGKNTGELSASEDLDDFLSDIKDPEQRRTLASKGFEHLINVDRTGSTKTEKNGSIFEIISPQGSRGYKGGTSDYYYTTYMGPSIGDKAAILEKHGGNKGAAVATFINRLPEAQGNNSDFETVGMLHWITKGVPLESLPKNLAQKYMDFTSKAGWLSPSEMDKLIDAGARPGMFKTHLSSVIAAAGISPDAVTPLQYVGLGSDPQKSVPLMKKLVDTGETRGIERVPAAVVLRATDVMAIDRTGQSYKDSVARGTEAAKLLTAAGFDLNAQDNKGRTPLIQILSEFKKPVIDGAATKSRYSTAEANYLGYHYGHDGYGAKNADGVAVEVLNVPSRLAAYDALVAAGADPKAKDDKGKSAQEYRTELANDYNKSVQNFNEVKREKDIAEMEKRNPSRPLLPTPSL